MENVIDAQPKKTVVVVDDNQQDLELMAHYIVRLGYNAVTFTNGNEGLDWLAKQNELPPLTLCDIRMDAGIDGFEFAKKFRKLKGGDFVALLAYTGYVSDHVKRKTIEAGFDGCINKPPNAAALDQSRGAFVRLK